MDIRMRISVLGAYNIGWFPCIWICICICIYICICQFEWVCELLCHSRGCWEYLGAPPPRYLACINFIGVQVDTNTHGSVSVGRGFWPFSDQAWWSRFGYMLYILVISIRLQKRKKKTLMKIRGVYGPELWHFNVGVTVVTAHTCHNSGHPSLSQSRIWVCTQIWYFSLFAKENEKNWDVKKGRWERQRSVTATAVSFP